MDTIYFSVDDAKLWIDSFNRIKSLTNFRNETYRPIS